MCLRGRNYRGDKSLPMSMIVHLCWPMASTSRHAALSDVRSTPFEAC